MKHLDQKSYDEALAQSRREDEDFNRSFRIEPKLPLWEIIVMVAVAALIGALLAAGSL